MAMKLIEQVAVIFLLMGVGVVLRKRRMIGLEAARMVSNFVMVVVVPSVVIQAFQREMERELLAAMGASLLLAAAFHLLAVAVTHWFPRPRDDAQYPVERLLAVCSNCGFMGIPLMTAIMGEKGMLYAVLYVAVFNIYLWTHGVMILRKTRKLSAREIFCTPGMAGVAIGAALFLCQVRLPSVAAAAVEYIAAMNTPLPTIITGVFIADVPVRRTLCNRRVYVAAAMRLIILPLLFIALIWAMRVPDWFEGAGLVAVGSVICSCCSGAITTTMMPARFGADAPYGAALIAVSTVFCILTIPLMATLALALFAA